MPISADLKPATSPEKRWNVVVVGKWNRAILTPKGIARRLFGLAEGTEIRIEVPTDVLAPFRVGHGNLIVAVDEERLIVECGVNDFDCLASAIGVARTAVTELPETPFAAAGFNATWEAPTIFPQFDKLWTASCDSRLEKAGYAVNGRALSRTVAWRDGKINVGILFENPGPYHLMVNFHRKSVDAPDLRKWLSVSAQDIEAESTKLSAAFVGLEDEK